MSEGVANVLNDILRVETIEEAFSCFLVHRATAENEKISGWQQDLTTALRGASTEQMELAVRQYLSVAAGASHSRLQLLMDLLDRLVHGGVLPPRLVCEAIIANEKLSSDHQDFWLESFKLLRSIIDGVEYKGVREIMKGCCEKAKTLPKRLHAGLQPQMQVLLQVCEHIMNRDVCLLPGYLLVNELQKAYPDYCPHWRLAELFSDYIESFRGCAQMVSVVGQAEMRPVVEHSGQPEHLVNPWKLDPLTLRFTLKGTLPYAPELLEKQTGLLRFKMPT